MSGLKLALSALVIFAVFVSTAQADCSDEQFKCSSGECIHKDLRCDYEADCEDGSDEDENSSDLGCEAIESERERDYYAEEPECRRREPGMVPCGEPCRGMGFVCDGMGDCVDAMENPCVQRACGGIGCGDSCFMRDINVAGVCDWDARCATVAFDRKVECQEY